MSDTLNSAPPTSNEHMRYPDKKDYSERAASWLFHPMKPTAVDDRDGLPNRFKPGDKYILCDIDGVLVDWIAGFEAFIRPRLAEMGRKPRATKLHYLQDLRVWIMDSEKPEDLQVGQDLILEYQISEEAARAPAFRDAVAQLPRIAALGYTFVAVSTAGDHPEIANRRAQLLEHHFPGIFESLYLLPPLTNKATVLEYFQHAPTFFVDDMLKQCTGAAVLGHKAILLDRDPAAAETVKHYSNIQYHQAWGPVHWMLSELEKAVA